MNSVKILSTLKMLQCYVQQIASALRMGSLRHDQNKETAEGRGAGLTRSNADSRKPFFGVSNSKGHRILCLFGETAVVFPSKDLLV